MWEERGTGGRHIVLIATAVVLTLPLFLPLFAPPASASSPHPSVAPSIRSLRARNPVPMSGYVPAGRPPVVVAAIADPVTIPFGTQYRVTNNPGAQNEVSIAVNPTNPLNIVAMANDYRGGAGWCGVYATTDGGGTWVAQLLPPGGGLMFLEASRAPSLGVAGDGDAHAASLGFNPRGNPANASN